MKFSVLISFFIILFASSHAQIIEYSFNSNPYLESSFKAENLTTSTFALNTGGTISVNQTTTVFTENPYIAASGGWAETAQTTAKNFFFEINASLNAKFTITRITFEAYATDAGPSGIGISIGDNAVYQSNMPASSVQIIDQNITNFENLSYAKIKIQGWDNGSRITSGGGSFRIDNIKIYGEVQVLDIEADRIKIIEIPTFIVENQKWSVKVAATDELGAIDTDFAENLTFSKYSGNGEITSQNGFVTQFANGIAYFENLTYTGNDNFSLFFETQNLTNSTIISPQIIVAEQLSIENFNDNNISANPIWFGNTNYFSVNSSLELESNGPDTEASKIFLSTINQRINETEWQFTVNLGFNPTSTNFVRIYLAASNLDLTANNDAYFIQIGQTGSDFIKLMKQNGSVIEEIASGLSSYNSNIYIKIKAVKDHLGTWKIFSANPDSENYMFEMTATDNSFTTSNFFGFYCEYATVSRYNLFRFDNIYVGDIIPDIENPYIKEVKAITKNKIRITFSEFLEENALFTLTNYKLNTTINPILIQYSSENKTIIELTFLENFTAAQLNSIFIQNINDLAGNQIESQNYDFIYNPLKFNDLIINSNTKISLLFSQELQQAYAENEMNFLLNNNIIPLKSELSVDKRSILLTFTEPFINNTSYNLTLNNAISEEDDVVEISDIQFVYHKTEFGDLVFTEIMPDPEPTVGLPPYEYMELFNRSNYTISLIDFELIANTSIKKLVNFNLKPQEYLILCKTGEHYAFQEYGNVLPLESFPALTNSEMYLQLISSEGEFISSVDYSNTWITNELKRDGGWSIEKIDPDNICGEAENWKESLNYKGGTPGQQNSIHSVNPDITSPFVKQINYINENTVELIFSESLLKENTNLISNFQADNGLGNPIEIIFEQSNPKHLQLQFAINFEPQIIYNLTIRKNVTDCAGNSLDKEYVLRFAIPQEPLTNDLIINELLFNPMPNAYDFIEIYNKSEKVLDLKDLSFTTRDESGNLKTRTEINSSFLIFPTDYVVITSDAENLKQSYFVDNENNIVQNELPTLPDDVGNIVIVNKNLEIIDELNYQEDMHNDLLSNNEGVSLERIDFETSTNNSINWQSAAQSVGWATPTYKNSAYKDITQSTEILSVSPEVFSPDHDGYDDLVFFNYKVENTGFFANLAIYDSNGFLIKQLINNELVASEGYFTWDGSFNNEPAKMGIYIIYAEFFDTNGNIQKAKKTFVLAKKL